MSSWISAPGWAAARSATRGPSTSQGSVSPGGTELTGSLVNTAPYALFISRGQVVQNLIWKPGQTAAEAMVDDIAKGIAQ